MESHEGDKKDQPMPTGAGEPHHFAAPEVEERPPHAYSGEGLHRRESLKADLPEEMAEKEGHR